MDTPNDHTSRDRQFDKIYPMVTLAGEVRPNYRLVLNKPANYASIVITCEDIPQATRKFWDIHQMHYAQAFNRDYITQENKEITIHNSNGKAGVFVSGQGTMQWKGEIAVAFPDNTGWLGRGVFEILELNQFLNYLSGNRSISYLSHLTFPDLFFERIIPEIMNFCNSNSVNNFHHIAAVTKILQGDEFSVINKMNFLRGLIFVPASFDPKLSEKLKSYIDEQGYGCYINPEDFDGEIVSSLLEKMAQAGIQGSDPVPVGQYPVPSVNFQPAIQAQESDDDWCLISMEDDLARNTQIFQIANNCISQYISDYSGGIIGLFKREGIERAKYVQGILLSQHLDPKFKMLVLHAFRNPKIGGTGDNNKGMDLTNALVHSLFNEWKYIENLALNYCDQHQRNCFDVEKNIIRHVNNPITYPLIIPVLASRTLEPQ